MPPIKRPNSMPLPRPTRDFNGSGPGARPIDGPAKTPEDTALKDTALKDSALKNSALKDTALKGIENSSAVDSIAPSFKDASLQQETIAQAHVATGHTEQKTPSMALNQKARIMSPHLLFNATSTPAPTIAPQSSQSAATASAPDDKAWFDALLEKPFNPTSRIADDVATGPILAKLPPARSVPVGKVDYRHDDGVLTVVGEGPETKKPEVVTKKMGLGAAAQFAVAFDAALAATYPKYSTQDPPEMWVGMAGADRAATLALKMDAGQRSPYDAAKMLRTMLPKSTPIVATKTVMDQIQQWSGLASKITTGDPAKNLVDLEEQVLVANGSSLIEEIFKAHDRKTGARTALDDLLDQPVKPAPLPDDDRAVVARVGNVDVTAGEIRDQAFRSQKAVAFQIPGFADAHGRQQTLTLQIEKRGKGFEWSFYGVAGTQNRVLSGAFSPEGLEKLKDVIEKQPRYDHVKYETKVPRVNARLTDAALVGLEKDRQAIAQEHDARGGGVPIHEIFPDWNPS